MEIERKEQTIESVTSHIKYLETLNSKRPDVIIQLLRFWKSRLQFMKANKQITI